MPDFTVKDVNGKTISLSDYRGKKILMTFYRNVGCPICNLRFHEIQEKAELFKSNNMSVVAVYESSPENMRKYLGNENPYAVMVPNQEHDLYHHYGIEKSPGKVFGGLFHGAIGKAARGKKLFGGQAVQQDGNGNTIGADFLVAEDGMVHTAYYGKFLSDHLPMEDIIKFLEN